MDPSSMRGIFVRYNEISKAYRVYIPRERKIIVSRHVRFEEGGTFRRSHATSPAMVED